MATRALAFFIIALSLAFAQEPRSTIAAMNKALAASDQEALAHLFTADAEFRIGRRVVATGAADIAAALVSHPVWSEVSPPRIARESIRLLSPDIALVDAEQIRYGTMIGRQRTNVMLLLKRTSSGWQVLSLRWLPEPRAPAVW